MNLKSIYQFKPSYLTINKPEKNYFSLDLTAVQIKFLYKVLEDEAFDVHEYMEKLCHRNPLEFLEIYNENNIESLPFSLIQTPLKYLSLRQVKIKDLSNVLPKLYNLEEFCIDNISGCIKLGKGLSKLNQLKKISIYSQDIEDIEEIWHCKNLEYLHLRVTNLNKIPKEVNNLKNLKTLIIDNGTAFEFASQVDFPVLERLILRLNSTHKIPESIFSPTLKEVRIHNNNEERDIKLPNKLNLPLLNTLEFNLYSLSNIPELTAPSLISLHLRHPLPQDFLLKINDANKLEHIVLGANESDIDLINEFNQPIDHEINFGKWPLLKCLTILNPVNYLINISQNHQLKQFVSWNDNFITSLEGLPQNIEELSINNSKKLSVIKINNSLSQLQKVNISGCPNLHKLEFNHKNTPQFNELLISRCPSLNKLPLDTIFIQKILIQNRGNGHDIISQDIKGEYTKIHNHLMKKEVPINSCLAIGFWVFNHQRFNKISEKIVNDTLYALQFSNDVIFNLISQNIYLLNDNQSFKDLPLQHLENKSMVILGNTFSAKTQIKAQIKELGIKPITKIEDADYILLAKKAKIEKPLKNSVIFLTETVLGELIERKTPKFLQEKNTSHKVKNNLRQILWSTDPETEMLALEMMKNGGMPKEIIGECIAIAKTSSNAKVKSRYKTFLKGQISSEEFRLVSHNVRLLQGKDPFRNLKNKFSDSLLGKLAAAIYKRHGKFWEDVLNLNFEDMDIRMEIIENTLIPLLLKKPHYIQIPVTLKNSELKIILDRPEILGKLKRLHFYSKEENLPIELEQHITLKELIIRGDLQGKKIPKVIYSLVRLTTLEIDISNLESIDKEISNLKQLKKLNLHHKSVVEVSNELESLTKLVQCYLSGPIQGNTKWKNYRA